LLALSIVFTALFVGSVVATAVMTGGGHVPSPFDAESRARTFFASYAGAAHLGAFLQLGAAILLGLFTATAVSRLRFLGVKAAGVDIALFGGFTAAILSAGSALVQWAVAQSGIAVTGTADLRTFQVLFFALGGPGTVAGAGLLAAGVSVSGALAGLLPRWLMWFGLVLAALAELSTFTLVTPAAAYLLPAARFPMLAWMICVGALLPRSVVAGVEPASRAASRGTVLDPRTT
jgi:hypothetical protein